MEPHTFSIRFQGTSSAEANRWASELKQNLLDAHSEVRVSQTKARTDTMDLGSILEVVLGSVAVREVAKGMFVWLQKRHNANIEITKKGAIKATGLRGKDVLAIAEMILNQDETP